MAHVSNTVMRGSVSHSQRLIGTASRSPLFGDPRLRAQSSRKRHR